LIFHQFIIANAIIEFYFFLRVYRTLFQSSLHIISCFNDDNEMILVALIFRFKQLYHAVSIHLVQMSDQEK